MYLFRFEFCALPSCFEGKLSRELKTFLYARRCESKNFYFSKETPANVLITQC